MVSHPPDDTDAPQTTVTRWAFSADENHPQPDQLAREEPLAIHIGGIPITVVMRTPGDDIDLARGFLLSERIVDHPSRIRSIRHCDQVAEGQADNAVVLVVLAPEAEFDAARLRRNFFVASSCGICGKASLEAALATAPPLLDTARPKFAPEQVYALPPRLERAQEVFAETGGLHGAALFDHDGRCLGVREDVGRHNAVDKVLGAHAQCPDAATPAVLLVSGRVSFEIVQKALALRIPIVAAISAPTSLAVELAEAAGITLIGFLRDRRMSVYSHPRRIQP